MKNYEEFKEEFMKELETQIVENHVADGVAIEKMYKANMQLDGIRMNPANRIAPAVYVQRLYEDYQQGASMEELLNKTVEIYRDSPENQKLLSKVNDFSQMGMERMKENVIPTLINAEKNRNMLERTPHVAFEDLAVVFRVISHTAEGGMSAIVTQLMLEAMDISVSELYEYALNNPQNKESVSIKKMDDITKEFMRETGTPEELIAMIMPEQSSGPQMYVITNEEKMYGAGAILFEDKIHDLAMELESDLYILPSSLHEMIMVTTGWMPLDELAEMVRDINVNEVDETERLSDHVYSYDRRERKFALADSSMQDIQHINDMKKQDKSR